MLHNLTKSFATFLILVSIFNVEEAISVVNDKEDKFNLGVAELYKEISFDWLFSFLVGNKEDVNEDIPVTKEESILTKTVSSYGDMYSSIGLFSFIDKNTISDTSEEIPIVDTSVSRPRLQMWVFGQSSETTRKIQIALNETKCMVAQSGAGSPGKETTYFGPKTERAVRCYQRLNNLPTTGRADERTQISLFKKETDWIYDYAETVFGMEIDKEFYKIIHEIVVNGPSSYTEKLVKEYVGEFERNNLFRKFGEDIFILAQNAYHESRSEGHDGMVSVTEVVLNRMGDSKSAKDIITEPKQFSWTNNKKVRWQKHFNSDGMSDSIIAVIDAVMFDEDITNGADHYHADYVEPYWAKHMVAVNKVGSHIFYTS